MKVAIMQPYIFPYLGYFQLMNIVDKWIVFDDIQFINKGWINRNRILHPDHTKVWQYITIPLEKRGHFDKICDVSINSEIDWRAQILGKLTAYKKKAPYYNQTIDFVRYCLDSEENNLARLVVDVLKKTTKHIGISTNIKVQSEMNLQVGEIYHSGQWALRISELLGATEYINPFSGAEIFKNKEFENSKIKLSFLKPKLNLYEQSRKEFVPGLSIIDVLMFNSISETNSLLNKNNYEIL
tara:strand:+ start:309 stop:1028 length:720 start_codon:yes stop_codon:yes gene_type:complete